MAHVFLRNIRLVAVILALAGLNAPSVLAQNDLPPIPAHLLNMPLPSPRSFPKKAPAQKGGNATAKPAASRAFGVYSLAFTLSWSDYTDIDLHVITPSGQHIYYATPGSYPNGYLHYDDTTGKGPEWTTWWDTPPSGWYQVYAHNYRGDKFVSIQIQTFVNGAAADMYPGDAHSIPTKLYTGMLRNSNTAVSPRLWVYIPGSIIDTTHRLTTYNSYDAGANPAIAETVLFEAKVRPEYQRTYETLNWSWTVNGQSADLYNAPDLSWLTWPKPNKRLLYFKQAGTYTVQVNVVDSMLGRSDSQSIQLTLTDELVVKEHWGAPPTGVGPDSKSWDDLDPTFASIMGRPDRAQVPNIFMCDVRRSSVTNYTERVNCTYRPTEIQALMHFLGRVCGDSTFVRDNYPAIDSVQADSELGTYAMKSNGNFLRFTRRNPDGTRFSDAAQKAWARSMLAQTNQAGYASFPGGINALHAHQDNNGRPAALAIDLVFTWRGVLLLKGRRCPDYLVDANGQIRYGFGDSRYNTKLQDFAKSLYSIRNLGSAGETQHWQLVGQQ